MKTTRFDSLQNACARIFSHAPAIKLTDRIRKVWPRPDQGIAIFGSLEILLGIEIIGSALISRREVQQLSLQIR